MKRVLEAAVQSFNCAVQLRVISCCLFIGNVKHSTKLKPKAGSPRSEVIVLGTPKQGIQVKVEAFAHVAAFFLKAGWLPSIWMYNK
jgi:hypothetical protein